MSPIEYGLGGPHGAPSWGAGYKKALIEQANRKLTMVQLHLPTPVETNRVDLDPDVKDAWGLPAMRITRPATTTTSRPCSSSSTVRWMSSRRPAPPRSGLDDIQDAQRRRAFPRHLPHGQ